MIKPVARLTYFYKIAILLLFSTWLLCLNGCSVLHQPHALDDISPKINHLITNYVDIDNSEKKDRVYGVSVYIESRKNAISWGAASGFTDKTLSTPLMPENPIRIASITKTFVAASILRLNEQGKITLDNPINFYLKPYHQHILKQGGYDIEAITVRHLLTHTSGLYDYADSEQFYKAFTEKPDYRWTRTEQLQGAMDWGEPYGSPGEVFKYSDTGYILLAEMVELLEKKSLGLALKSLLNYQELGLDSTWLESFDQPPEHVLTRAHQYLGEMDFFNHDPSFDLYGGGGLVSTPKDLAVFFSRLFTGSVYKKSVSKEKMLTGIRKSSSGKVYPQKYRLGINTQQINGSQVISHGGYFGTYVGYIPDLDLAIAINMTQHYAEEKKKALFSDLVLLLKKEKKVGVFN